jgi:hypothetical protein
MIKIHMQSKTCWYGILRDIFFFRHSLQRTDSALCGGVFLTGCELMLVLKPFDRIF